jgi:hypothetical protein
MKNSTDSQRLGTLSSSDERFETFARFDGYRVRDRETGVVYGPFVTAYLAYEAAAQGYSPIPPEAVLTIVHDLPAMVQTAKDRWDKPTIARAGWQVVIRKRDAGKVIFDVINGTAYRASADCFEAALTR